MTTAIFDNNNRQTYFSGSYLELRDRPSIVGLPEYYTRLDFFSDKRLSLTTYENNPSTYGLLLNGTFDCQRMLVNELSVRGGEITNISAPLFSHSATPKSYVDSRAPAWLSAIGTTQASVNLSGFNKDLTWSHILSKPPWLQFYADVIPLSGFYNDLPVPASPVWNDIGNRRPLWTDHFGFSQGILTKWVCATTNHE
jgi:hypothetical protein